MVRELPIPVGYPGLNGLESSLDWLSGSGLSVTASTTQLSGEPERADANPWEFVRLRRVSTGTSQGEADLRHFLILGSSTSITGCGLLLDNLGLPRFLLGIAGLFGRCMSCGGPTLNTSGSFAGGITG